MRLIPPECFPRPSILLLHEDVRELCCCGNWERTWSIANAHQETSMSHWNVAANNHSLHTDAGTCAQRWTMNEHSFFLYRDWKQNPKNRTPTTTTTAFQVSALFNQALKWSLNPSCSGQKWPQLANNPSPFKPHSQPTRQHRAASASGLDSRRTFRLIHISPRLPFSFSSSLHCVLKKPLSALSETLFNVTRQRWKTRVHRFGMLNRKLYLSGLLLPITSTLYPPPHEKGCWGGLRGEASRAIAKLESSQHLQHSWKTSISHLKPFMQGLEASPSRHLIGYCFRACWACPLWWGDKQPSMLNEKGPSPRWAE